MAEPSISIQESVGEALRFARAQWRFSAMAAGAGAGVITLLSLGAQGASVLALPFNLAMGLAQACTFAALLGAAMYGAGAVRTRWFADGVRVWGAMAIVVILLFLLLVVATMPVVMVLLSGPLAPYVPELQRAGSDQAQVMAVMTRFAESNPGVLLALALAYGAIVLVITSRLFLAAPASIDRGRILTFQTWSWTKGAMWRIAGARLMLLVPANILAGALGYLVGRLAGVDPMAAAAAQADAPGFLVYIAASAFFSLALFSPLEAGLSAVFYRRLKPPEAPRG